MKPYPILLALLCPILSFAGDYRYDRIQVIENGSDYFKLHQQSLQLKTGTIVLNRKAMIIDEKEYKLRATRKRWRYRIKGGIVKLEYNAGHLVAVQVRQYNQAYKYCIIGTDVSYKKAQH